MPLTPVRVLSFHAGYGCRHSGRCCTSNWPIAMTPPEADRVYAALGAGGIEHTPDGPILERAAHGACAFHDTGISGGCRIQRVLGHDALPLECRQFPRQSVTDPRGTSVTLSHYCPTARAQLDDEGPVTILDDAPGFPTGGEYVGLEATSALPPLLHPRCLLDWENWWWIERRAVALVSDRPDTALPRLAVAVEHLRTWQPSDGPLADRASRAFELADTATLPAWQPPASLIASHVDDARAAVPDEWQEDADRALSVRAAPLPWPVYGRFLAAHTFANWTAYGGRGLRAWYRSIEAAGCLVWLTGDPGATDLVLRHLADSSALITRWSRSEDLAVIRRP